MVNRQVRVGIIGAGYWGEKLIGEYLRFSSKNPKIKLSAIVDIDVDRLKYIKEKYGIPGKLLYKNYLDVLNNSKVDAVHISAPNEFHYEFASRAIEKRKHVLLEKPMTLSSRSAFKLARESEKAGIVLLVDHIFRFNNAVNLAKKMLEEDVLGELYYINLKWITYMEKLPYRDIIFDLAPHPIDIINHLLEEWPSRVYSRARSFKRREDFEDSAFILMELPEGQVANVSLSWIQHGPKIREIELIGEKSSLYINALTQNVRLYKAKSDSVECPTNANNPIETLLAHFINRIITGEPPVSSPLIGAMTIYVIERIKESLKKNQSINVVMPP
ncbi:MAG: Gfo/Idh/MocA family oxidoreductase [Thermoproteota archaeon]